jgi:hypothetical protein
MNDMNRIRELAGLSHVTEATEAHESKETATFDAACEALDNVAMMCDQRLKGEVSDEHKKQYTELKTCVQQCCGLMKKHLKSYK